MVAALLGARELELLAQHVEQRRPRVHGDLAPLAVDRERQLGALGLHAPGRYALSSSSATCRGSSHIGRWPASRRITVRTFGRRMAQPRHHPVVLGPGERHGHADPRQPGERVRAHRRVDVGEARRERVGADQVARRGRGHPLRVRDEHPHDGAAQRGHARERTGERQRQPRGRAGRGAPRRERLGPQPGGPDRRHRARPAGEGELERDPAAERVAGHREVLDPAGGEPVRDRLGEPRRRRLGSPQRRRAAEAGQVDGDHLALAREQRGHGRPDAAVGAERVQQHQRGARSPCGRARATGGGGGRGHALATLRSGSRAGVAGRQCGLANSACASPIRCSAKPASQ